MMKREQIEIQSHKLVPCIVWRDHSSYFAELLAARELSKAIGHWH